MLHEFGAFQALSSKSKSDGVGQIGHVAAANAKSPAVKRGLVLKTVDNPKLGITPVDESS